MKNEQYKVVVRERLTHAIIVESQLIGGYDPWIKACGVREDYKAQYNLNDYEVEILEVK